MKRRKFISAAGASVVLPTLINGFSMKAFGQSKWMNMLAAAQVNTDRVLVIINLNGGNDGLNTVIPLDQYSALSAARSNILLPENEVLALAGSTLTGLHPEMGGMQSLFGENKLRIIQSVGYPDPNYSHFRATDIWASGSDSDQVLNSGVMGRFLDYAYPGFPEDYPNEVMPDPLALQIGNGLPLLFQGANGNNAMTISGESIFQDWQNPTGTNVPNSWAGQELAYIRTVIAQTEVFAGQIINAFNYNVAQYSGYPAAGSNRLADQLKIVAKLIAGGLKTRIYFVNITGFDNHSEQVDTTNHSAGTHATLLKQVSEAIYAFQMDCEGLNISDKVMGMTFSEFGRRIKSNASLGTDHGAAAPLFLFGTQVNGGLQGDNPVIPASVSENDNLPMQYDFRAVYTSILKDWFCVEEQGLLEIMLQNFPAYPLCNGDCSNVGYNHPGIAHTVSALASPNPFSSRFSVDYTVPEGHNAVVLYDCNGQVLKELRSGHQMAGSYRIFVDAETYPAGNYYIQVRCRSEQKTVWAMKVR